MYMGGVPVAEHGTLLPGSISTAAKTILGGTSEVMFEFSLHLKIIICNSLVCSSNLIKKARPLIG